MSSYPQIGYSERAEGGLVELGVEESDNPGLNFVGTAVKKATTAHRRRVALGRAAQQRHNRTRSNTSLVNTDRFTAMLGKRRVGQGEDKAWERLKGEVVSAAATRSAIPASERSSGIPAVDDLAVDGRPGATYAPGFRALHVQDMNGGDMIDVTAVDPASTALGMVHEVDGKPVVPSAEAVFLAVEQRDQRLL